MLKRYIPLLISLVFIGMAEDRVSISQDDINLTRTKQQQINNGDILLAVVNGHQIKKSFFDKGFHKADLKTQKKLLKRVIASELLVEYAEKQPNYNAKEVLDAVAKVEHNRQKNGRKFTALDKRMVQGLYVVNLEATKYADKMITEEMIKNYYDKRKRNFKKMTYSRIYTLKLDNMDDVKKALKILNKADNKKSAFISLIKQYNIGTLKEQLNSSKKLYKFGSMNTPFNRELFHLKTGEYTKKPIEKDDAYYLIYCLEKSKSKSVPTFDELKHNIYTILHHKEANKWLNEKVKELKLDAKIENYLDK